MNITKLSVVARHRLAISVLPKTSGSWKFEFSDYSSINGNNFARNLETQPGLFEGSGTDLLLKARGGIGGKAPGLKRNV
jgi:hypothetical protein